MALILLKQGSLFQKLFCGSFIFETSPWNCFKIFEEKKLNIKETFTAKYFCSFVGSAVPDEVEILYRNGLPIVTVPLPSRQEKCRFTLKPILNTAGDFLADIQKEDKGVDRVTVQTTDGVKIASSTSIASIMQDNFHLTINEKVYLVCPPKFNMLTSENMEDLSNIRACVSHLYEVLHVEQHQLKVERQLVEKLENILEELDPLEKKKDIVLKLASKRSNILSWLGLAMMGAQFGILARLTWWEYSWDIMEPVTYFITYGTTIAMYAYFVITRQEYVLPVVSDRHTLTIFHEQANKHGLDLNRYNELKNLISKVEEDLKRLKDPLQLHLPIKDPTSFTYCFTEDIHS